MPTNKSTAPAAANKPTLPNKEVQSIDKEPSHPIKPKRTPKPAPEPPNPHVLELQAQIIRLVGMREQLQERESATAHQAALAQLESQSARQALARVENEVNYRLDLVAKMTGKESAGYAPAPSYSNYAEQALKASLASEPIPFPAGIGAVGSIPSRPMVGGGPDGNVRMESADDIRRSL